MQFLSVLQRIRISWAGRTHKDHWVQLPAPHKATYKSDPMSDRTVQMLLKLQLSAMITTLESLFRAHNLFLTPHLSLHWTQLRVVASGPVGAPPLPVRSCSRHQASPQLLCSVLSKPRGLSCSSHTLPSWAFAISVALFWMLSNSCMSSLYCGTRTAPSARGEATCGKFSSRIVLNLTLGIPLNPDTSISSHSDQKARDRLLSFSPFFQLFVLWLVTTFL